MAQNAAALDHIYVRDADGAPVPLSADRPLRRRRPRRWRSTTRASSRRSRSRSTSRPGESLGDAVTAIQAAQSAHRDAAERARRLRRAPRRPSTSRWRASRCSSWPRSSPSTSCSACSTRATSTRSRSSRRCPRRASARSWRSCVCQTDFSVIALIGIVLLIGIVKKNAIMMIDFALEAERDHGHGARASDPPGVPAPLPADHDDDDGGAPRRPAARARHRAWGPSCGGRSASRIVGGLLISQVLTLYTTPVVYLYMDRLGRVARRSRQPVEDAGRRAPRAGRPGA